MGDGQIVVSTGPVLTPESVMSRTFSAAFRGYHPAEVRQFLKLVSHELAAGAAREAELRRALEEARDRAAHPVFDHAAMSSGSTAWSPATPERTEERRPRPPRPPDRPAMRPQTVADAAPGRLVASPSHDSEVVKNGSGPGESGPSARLSSPPAPDPVVVEQALAGRDELLESIETGLARALKRVLQDEQNVVLDGLRRLGPSDAVLPEPAAHLASYRDVALPWLQRAARAGVGHASGAGPGPEDNVVHPLIESQAEALVSELVEPLRERLLRTLADGAASEDIAVVGESTRAVYRQWRAQRMEDAARHHAVAAFALGAFAATPAGAALQWLVDDDGHCPDCDDNALAGLTPKGQPFPTGQFHPPAHQGCRCLLVPATA